MEVWHNSINDILVPHIFNGLQEAYKTVNRLTGGVKVLLAFQITLEQIRDLSQNKITDDYSVLMNSIKKMGHDALWFQTMIKHLYHSYAKSAITSIGLECGNNFDMNLIEVLPAMDFVHAVYINTAREVWKKPMLFSHKGTHIFRQANNNEIIEIIKNSVIKTVRDGLNLNQLLESVNTGTALPLPSKKTTESVSLIRERFQRLNQDNMFTSKNSADNLYLMAPHDPSVCEDTIDNDNIASDQDTISEDDPDDPDDPERADEMEQVRADEIEQENADEIEEENADEIEQKGADEIEQENADEIEQENADEMEQENADEMEQKGADEIEQEDDAIRELERENSEGIQKKNNNYEDIEDIEDVKYYPDDELEILDDEITLNVKVMPAPPITSDDFLNNFKVDNLDNLDNETNYTIATAHTSKTNKTAATIATARTAMTNKTAATIHTAKTNKTAATIATAHTSKTNKTAATIATAHTAKTNKTAATIATARTAKGEKNVVLSKPEKINVILPENINGKYDKNLVIKLLDGDALSERLSILNLKR
jgi:hypothetical protein